MSKLEQELAAVVIGRNEGQRLITCLTSLLKMTKRVVYVDSGSNDGSLDEARQLGVTVVELDLSRPFTAARARNAGAEKAMSCFPETRFIQFVDGDCEIDAGWLPMAYDFLAENTDYAVVCGRRRERFPEKTMFNQLCDIEWNTPIGDALACGGDALMRVDAYLAVSGYDDALIAGEEPELCFRLRREGWQIKRLDSEMTLHDADMTSIKQWWKRAKRAGYAYANGYQLHGQSTERFRYKDIRRIIAWALLIPLVIICLGVWESTFFMLVFIYLIQILRVMGKLKISGLSTNHAFLYSVSSMAAKWPQLFGIAEFLGNFIKGRQGQLIEYK